MSENRANIDPVVFLSRAERLRIFDEELAEIGKVREASLGPMALFSGIPKLMVNGRSFNTAEEWWKAVNDLVMENTRKKLDKIAADEQAIAAQRQEAIAAQSAAQRAVPDFIVNAAVVTQTQGDT